MFVAIFFAALACCALLAREARAVNTFPFVACTPAAPDIISPSCFEGGDGNLIVDDAAGNRIDWASLMGLARPATQYQDPRNPIDDVFKSSTAKEDTPGAWQIEIDKAPSKADIINTVFYTELVPAQPGHIFLYGGFESTAGGNTNVSFELNKGAANGDLTFDNDANAATPEVPYRSENDLLVTFDGGINNVRIGLCFWHGDNTAGNWFYGPNGGLPELGGAVQVCPALDHTQSEANINGADLPNSVLSLFSDPILMGNFGEMAVNLTTSIGAQNLCFSLGGIWMHSRSSSQANSTMEDYIVPQHINGANSCSQTVEKKVAVSPNAAADPTTLTYGDSSSANDGDTLFYTLAVTNTGTQPITHGNPAVAGPALTDANCSTPTIADADKLHPIAGQPANPDASLSTFDGGDVWVYRCTHLYNVANDGTTYVNTVTADGNVANFAVPQTTDHADVAVIPPGMVRAAKTVVGGAGGETWPFTVAGVAKAAIGNGDSTSAESVTAGTPTTITEGALAAGSGTFVVTDITCTKVGGGAVTYTPNLPNKSVSVTPAAGEDITCTFTNTKQGQIRAAKTVVGGHGGETWPFTVAGQVEPAIGDGLATGSETVAPGAATSISEGAQAAGTGTFDVTDITCTKVGGGAVTYTPNLAAGSVSVTPGAGEDITCTFTNTRRATVNAAKVVTAGKGNETFPLTVGATTTPGVASGGSTPDEVIVPGTPIAVREGGQDGGTVGTFASSVNCVDGQGGAVATANQTTTSVDVTPAAGQTITCTFTNVRAPDPAPPAPVVAPVALVPNPGISLAKTGPATAQAGSLVTYLLTVTNTGDQPFAEALVVVTDPTCQAPPQLIGPGDAGKNNDPSPGTLDPGESWFYSCQVQTQPGQTSVHNVGFVDATDPNGTHVAASDPADTALPSQAVLPEFIGAASARLRGPTGCAATRRPSTVVVTGKRIASVTFYRGSKKLATVRRGTKDPTRFALKINAARLPLGPTKITARVTFLPQSNLTSKTLALVVQHCTPFITPKFTG